jgi:hypothetical protein
MKWILHHRTFVPAAGRRPALLDCGFAALWLLSNLTFRTSKAGCQPALRKNACWGSAL